MSLGFEVMLIWCHPIQISWENVISGSDYVEMECYTYDKCTDFIVNEC
jgi:hypothetical protein